MNEIGKQTQSVTQTQARKLHQLRELASRQQSGRRKRSKIVLYSMLIILGLAMLAFGLFFILHERSYRVTFYMNSTIVDQLVVKQGSVLSEEDIPPAPAHPDDADFLGWHTNPKGDSLFDIEKPIESNLSLYAIFKPVIVEMTINLNDAGENSSVYPFIGEKGKLVALPTQLELSEDVFGLNARYKNNNPNLPADYILLGYSKQMGRDYQYSAGDFIPLETTTLFAIWQGREIDVSIHTENLAVNASGDVLPTKTTKAYFGDIMIVDTTTAEYAGFYHRETGAQIIGFTVDGVNYENGERIPLEAQFVDLYLLFSQQKNILTIDYDMGEDYPSEKFIGYNRTITFKQDIFKDHYILIGYKQEDTIHPAGSSILIEGELTYIAQWRPVVYEIELAADGVETYGTERIFLRYGDAFYPFNYSSQDNFKPENHITSIVPPVKANHDFLGYYTEELGEGDQIIDKDGNIIEENLKRFEGKTTLYAYFSTTTFTVTAIGNEFGTIYPYDSDLNEDGKYQVAIGKEFRFRVKLTNPYTQDYANLEANLKANTASIYKAHAGKTDDASVFILPNVQADISITVPEMEINKYTIVWRNRDASIITSGVFDHGTAVSFPGQDPTYPSPDGILHYQFIGWDEELEPATANKIYTATYAKQVKKPEGIIERVYSGGPQSIWEETKYYIIESTQPEENVGNNYTAKVTLKEPKEGEEPYSWVGSVEDPDVESFYVTWKITSLLLSIPTLPEGFEGLTYNAATQDIRNDLVDLHPSIIVTGNEGMAAGDYTVTFKLNNPEGINNYLWSDESTEDIQLEWSIEGAGLVIKAADIQQNEGYPIGLLTFQSSALQGGDTLIDVIGEQNLNGVNLNVYDGDILVENLQALSPGVYRIDFSNHLHIAPNNYIIDWQAGKLTIRANDLVECPYIEWDEEENKYEYTSSVITPTIVGYDQNTMEMTGTRSAVGAGKYQLTFTLKGTNTWVGGDTKPITIEWEITKATLLGMVDDIYIDYGTSLPQFSVGDIVFDGFKGGDGKYNAITNINSPNAFVFKIYTEAGVEVPADNLNAGNYIIVPVAEDASADNYSFITKAITPENVNLRVSAIQISKLEQISEENLTYNGKQQSIVDTLIGQLSPYLTFAEGSVHEATGASVFTAEQGYLPYKALVKIAEEFQGNYVWAEDVVHTDGVVEVYWTIEKAFLNVRAANKSITSETLPDANQFLNGTPKESNTDLIFQGFKTEDDKEYAVDGEFYFEFEATDDEKVYTIKMSKGTAESENYQFRLDADGRGVLTIVTSSTLTKPSLVPETFQYNGQGQRPSIQDLNNEYMTVTYDYATEDGYAVDVDSYKIIITLNEGSSWEDGTYAPVELWWTISKRLLTIRAKDIEVVYGDEPEELSYEITGWATGHDELITANDIALARVDENGNPDENGATIKVTYTGTQQGILTNYDIQLVDGTFTELTRLIEIPEITQTIDYMATEIDIADYLSNFSKDGGYYQVLHDGASTRYATGSGKYSVTLKLMEGNLAWTGDYQWEGDDRSEIVIEWEITKAELTAIVEGKEITYGDDAPTFELSFPSGFVGGEDKSVIENIGGFVFTVYTQTDEVVENLNNINAGTYIVKASAGTATAANYTFNFLAGWLTVVPQERHAPTAQQLSYGYTGRLITLAFQTGTYDAEVMSVTGREYTDVNRNQHGEVIPYTATISLMDEHNYRWAEGVVTNGDNKVEIVWVITPAELTVQVDSLRVEYLEYSEAEWSDWQQIFNLQITGFKEGDQLEDAVQSVSDFTLDGHPAFNAPVGNYTVTPNASNVFSQNYTFKTYSKILTITPIFLDMATVEEDAPTRFTYDGTEKEILLTNVQQGITNVTDNIKTNAGEYNVVVALADPHNYRWKDGSNHGSIEDIKIPWGIEVLVLERPVIANADDMVYNGDNHSVRIEESDYYSINHDVVGKDAGEYTSIVSITVNDRENNIINAVWASMDGVDGDNYHMKWYIKKADLQFTQSGTYQYSYGQPTDYLNSILQIEQAVGVFDEPIVGYFEFTHPDYIPTLADGAVLVRFVIENEEDFNNYNPLNVTINITVTQLWLTFNTNGGTPVNPHPVNWNTTPEQPADPMSESHNFMGWYEDEGLTEAVDWNTYKLLESTTFHAAWQIKTYTISFKQDGSNGLDAVKFPNDIKLTGFESKEMEHGAEYVIDITAAPFTKEGYLLFQKTTGRPIAGVYYNDEIYSNGVIQITGDIQFTFAFNTEAGRDVVTVHYRGGEVDGSPVPEDKSVFIGRGTNIVLQPVQKRFYHLLGYVTDSTLTWETVLPSQFHAINNTQVSGGEITYYAVWEPIAIRFVYNGNGGQPTSITKNAKFLKNYSLDTGGFTRTYYDHDGWSITQESDEFGSNSKDFSFGQIINLTTEEFLLAVLAEGSDYTHSDYNLGDVELTITLYAAWQRRTVTVFFVKNDNGDTTTNFVHPTERQMVAGEQVYIETEFWPTEYERRGYTFEGWKNSGGDDISGNWVVPHNDITLYANWVPVTVKVTLNVNGGSMEGYPTTVYATFGKYTDYRRPTRTGYTFDGWFLGQGEGATRITYNGGYTNSSNLTEDATLYAKWEIRQFSFIIDPTGGEYYSLLEPDRWSYNPGNNTTTEYYYWGDPYILAEPTRSGYAFDGWYTSASGGNFIPREGIWQLDQNTRIYARWARVYELYVDANGGEFSGGESSLSIYLQYGDWYSIPTPSREYYYFDYWYIASSGVSFDSSGNYYYVQDITVRAAWSAETEECSVCGYVYYTEDGECPYSYTSRNDNSEYYHWNNCPYAGCPQVYARGLVNGIDWTCPNIRVLCEDCGETYHTKTDFYTPNPTIVCPVTGRNHPHIPI